MPKPVAAPKAAQARHDQDATDPGRAWLSQPLDRRPPRVVVESLAPSVDDGRFAARRIVGDVVVVTADVFAEGHDRLAVALRHRKQGATEWHETSMEPLGNDRWRGQFAVNELGFHEYLVEGSVDDYASWRGGLEKKFLAGQDVASDLTEGAALVSAAVARAGDDREALRKAARVIGGDGATADRVEAALDPALAALMTRHRDRSTATRSSPLRLVEVERSRARFGAWYELFPRSMAPVPGRHGTLRDCIARLPYVAGMGFDVLYLPPIHPIGTTHRKGKNNATVAGPGDVGSPWAIGGAAGGHDAVHPDLGTLDDFDALVAEAARQGIEVALDLALQCSPDHPWVREHPEWFRHRPDGSIHYAENPPKKYEDIFPVDFESDGWSALWDEILRVVRHWVGHGVRIFRVDNPHTKPFAFWEWLIRQVRAETPDVVFLSEAFTRPRVHAAPREVRVLPVVHVLHLAQHEAGADAVLHRADAPAAQRLPAAEPLRQHARHPARVPAVRRLRRPPHPAGAGGDAGGRATASTARRSSGARRSAREGTEEYADSEKYEVRYWPADAPGSLAPFIARVNAIRRDNPAFQYPDRLRFCPVDNDNLLAYTRTTPDGDNMLLVVVNLSPHHAHSGWVTLPLGDLGLEADAPFQVHDLLGDGRYFWQGPRNYVALDPQAAPAQVFRVRRRLRTERDFDYYL